jgi:hypothetical protein
MAVVFAVRGTLTARYSSGGPTGTAMGNTAPTTAADAGALSGNSIQFAANNNIKAVTWPARLNTPNGRTISVIVRYRPNHTGSPANNRAIFSLGSAAGRTACLELLHNTSGNLVVYARNENATVVMNLASAGAWSPTAGTWYDIVLTWDGTATASSCTVYVNASAIGSVTPTGAFSASWTNQYFNEITLGSGFQNGICSGDRFDELVIDDTVINPSSYTLESGSGSLNGSSRTSMIAATAYNALDVNDPTAAEIADAVWDEVMSGHTTADTFGAQVQKLLTLAKFLGLK